MALTEECRCIHLLCAAVASVYRRSNSPGEIEAIQRRDRLTFKDFDGSRSNRSSRSRFCVVDLRQFVYTIKNSQCSIIFIAYCDFKSVGFKPTSLGFFSAIRFRKIIILMAQSFVTRATMCASGSSDRFQVGFLSDFSGHHAGRDRPTDTHVLCRCAVGKRLLRTRAGN